MSDPAVHGRTLQRRLAALLPAMRQVRAGEGVLELVTHFRDAPRVTGATLLEGSRMEAHPIEGPPETAFRGFLDGIQRSEVIGHLGLASLIVGHAAAVVRERRDHRMRTWRAPRRESRLYAPRALMSAAAWDVMNALGAGQVIDTSGACTEGGTHPDSLRDAAIHLVQAHREALEHELAEAWCGAEREPLFIDGGISGSDAVAVSPLTVGVVKGHRTLYADGPALGVIMALEQGERSSVFRVTSRKRTAVASWYLRLRDATLRDPLWGLVRVEIAETSLGSQGPAARADAVSRWILAEASPLALPDARWDTMVYGIRDCEVFLRA